MGFSLHFHRVDEWPSHAWLARLKRRQLGGEVWHGAHVQIADEWFSEAVWDGSFEHGEFDATDIVAGSGGRVRGDEVRFVSSGSTVDRLQYLDDGDAIWVSNSLACLLSQTERQVEVTYNRYLHAFNSVTQGLRRYQKSIPLTKGTVQFVYFDNLQWDGQQIRTIAKPGADRRFESFDGYYRFLNESLRHVCDNMTNRHRTLTYKFLGTLSTGYDSTSVTALAQPFGLNEVLCFEGPGSRDLGSQIAHYFAVRPITISVQDWRQAKFPEVPFIAADGFGEEVHYSAVEATLKGRVLLTGYHGDKVWDKDTDYVSDEIIRGDISGLALTEYRLWAGFINCPLPFWGVRSVKDIRDVSRSQEMGRWDVGGDYTRPICRRIVESAGVPRDAFGMKKSFASRWLALADESVTASSRADCEQFLSEHHRRFYARGRIPPGLSRKFDSLVLNSAARMGGALCKTPGLFRCGMHHWPGVRGLVGLRIPNPPHTPFVVGYRRYLFPWAMSRATQRYSRQT